MVRVGVFPAAASDVIVSGDTMLIGLISERPAIERLDGIRYRKMSPKRKHGRLQFFLARKLDDQGGAFGETVPEWHCKVGQVDGTDSVLVPDVAWVNDERLGALSNDDAEIPPFAPDICIEIRSPGDDLTVLKRKIARYLATGAILALDVAPRERTVTAHTHQTVRAFRIGDRFVNDAAPWFSFEVSELFAAAERKRST